MLASLLALLPLLAGTGATRAWSPEELEFRNSQLMIAKEQLLAGPISLLADHNQYAPYKVDCPAEVTWIRNATGISEGEKKYLEGRGPLIDDAVKRMLATVNMTAPARRPVIGLALSGGGYRAMVNTLGSAEALFDGSNTDISGWLDATSYIVGLSGGSWAVGTFASNGGELPSKLAADVWNLEKSFIAPESNNTEYYDKLFSETAAKLNEGFPVQLTDVYGLALGEHTLPDKWRLDTKPNITLSALMQEVPGYANYSLPLPIIIAVGLPDPKAPAQKNSTVWEFNPFEFGSWDSSFTPIEYLGSPVDDGKNNGTCYKGYDQVSFIIGVSGTLFNALPFNAATLFQGTPEQLSLFDNDTVNVASLPNAFDPEVDGGVLTLVDGGENQQNLPFDPLLAKDRAVDAIIALDASGDRNGYPDGSAIYNTYKDAPNGTFPTIPSSATFVNEGLNTRPVFFGCDENTPLVVYVPHYPWVAPTNSSTFKFSYTDAELKPQMQSTLMSMSLNGTVDAWPTCLACALVDRANGADKRTEECKQCFSTFCWDGKENDTAPANYMPAVGPPEFVKNVKLDIAKPDMSKAVKNETAGGNGTAGKDGKDGAKNGAGSMLPSVVGVLAGAALYALF
ncbi:phospholipase B [Trichosporon asahii var. asahii CBS 8904]|uniref:Lysophospholipase n=1 Tax=Trichosporon asahii var. asahii (strain CBS 8904) TaxID=1220162 RepID=K1W613_TRIAC|nr:phospholipase B [Trichosporon asahii var. asahii CBS 8904]